MRLRKITVLQMFLLLVLLLHYVHTMCFISQMSHPNQATDNYWAFAICKTWMDIASEKRNRWLGICLWRTTLSGREKQMKREFLWKHSFRACRETVTTLVPQIPASLATHHFLLLAPITQHWPFNVTLPQCSLVLLPTLGHPQWPQFFQVFKWTSMQMTPQSVILCAVESHFQLPAGFIPEDFVVISSTCNTLQVQRQASQG